MTARRPALLIDIGGVLALDHLTAAAAAWGDRLGVAPHAFLAALFAGNDDQILVARVSEAAWWHTIAGRLSVNEELAAGIRADLAERQTWNTILLAGLRRIYATALHSVRAEPADALFIDDTPGHVDAARSLGTSGHLHTDTGETLIRIEEFVEGSPGSGPT